ncbi:MAG: hypothetical protein R2932_36835 [Caldilineaceae bacterium]
MRLVPITVEDEDLTVRLECDPELMRDIGGPRPEAEVRGPQAPPQLDGEGRGVHVQDRCRRLGRSARHDWDLEDRQNITLDAAPRKAVAALLPDTPPRSHQV